MEIINEDSISIEFLRSCYKPEISDTNDEIGSGNAQYIAYYTYQLQNIAKQEHLNDIFSDPIGIIKNPIIMKEETIETAKIIYTAKEHFGAKNELKRIINPNVKYKLIKEFGLEFYNSLLEKRIKEAEGTYFIHTFELIINKSSSTRVIRNGFLLKSLDDAGIKDFKELENFNAVFIGCNIENFSYRTLGFVKFKKK